MDTKTRAWGLACVSPSVRWVILPGLLLLAFVLCACKGGEQKPHASPTAKAARADEAGKSARTALAGADAAVAPEPGPAAPKADLSIKDRGTGRPIRSAWSKTSLQTGP